MDFYQVSSYVTSLNSVLWFAYILFFGSMRFLVFYAIFFDVWRRFRTPSLAMVSRHSSRATNLSLYCYLKIRFIIASLYSVKL